MKFKVYIMHSEKVDYKEEIYKPLLEKGLMDRFYLILPMTEKYINEYVKELINESDIIICDLTKFNFFANLELKTALKLGKDIKYFIRKDDKNINKYKKIEKNIYETKEEFVELVEGILEKLNEREILLARQNIFCLGKIQK